MEERFHLRDFNLRDPIIFVLSILSAFGLIDISGILRGRPDWYLYLIYLPLITIITVSFFIFIFIEKKPTKGLDPKSQRILRRRRILICGIIASIIFSWIVVAIAIIPPTEQERITQLINNEAEWTLQKDIDKIMTLFVDNAYVTDVQGGKTWIGLENIRQRYEWIFSHQNFTYLRHVDIKIAVKGDDAFVTCATEGLYNDRGTRYIIHNEGERWILKQIDGNWKVAGFVCNAS